MLYADFSTITFERNASAIFKYNHARKNGGAVYFYQTYILLVNESSLAFHNNRANNNNGGAAWLDHSNTTFEGNSLVTFYNNAANDNGGALFADDYSFVMFAENSTTIFCNNTADDSGGGFYIDHNSEIIYIGNSIVIFSGNIANLGGSVFSESSSISIIENSIVKFLNNTGLQDGEAIYLSYHSNFLHLNDANVAFHYNTASDYSGAIYAFIRGSSINFNSTDIHFKDNRAGIIQNSLHINVPRSCDRSCLFHSVNIANRSNFRLSTFPNKLLLHNPAKCIRGNNTNCDIYYMNNIMLGQDITFNACVLDYYDQPTEAAQFLITGMNHQDYSITNSKYITISCNHTAQGIAIIGNLHASNSYNYSVNISLYVNRVSESKIISGNLTIELSQCHPGFWYSSASQKCECYDTENIVSCSGSNSTIKRGYWFGSINGRSTATSCPNNYCYFTCCEITNGIYHLSPVRANQCKPHRSGAACGNCEEGYTLSFDSPECVEVNKCTIGHTVLVITLSVLYWIGVVVAVFVMMYFKVTIGSLYAIIYYYSIVDMLLSQVLFISNGLYTIVNIMSSLAKLTPQFLGQLCLVQNMSGIDQQFIHYVHPTVISLILVLIIMMARIS